MDCKKVTRKVKVSVYIYSKHPETRGVEINACICSKRPKIMVTRENEILKDCRCVVLRGLKITKK